MMGRSIALFNILKGYPAIAEERMEIMKSEELFLLPAALVFESGICL